MTDKDEIQFLAQQHHSLRQDLAHLQGQQLYQCVKDLIQTHTNMQGILAKLKNDNISLNQDYQDLLTQQSFLEQEYERQTEQHQNLKDKLQEQENQLDQLKEETRFLSQKQLDIYKIMTEIGDNQKLFQNLLMRQNIKERNVQNQLYELEKLNISTQEQQNELQALHQEIDHNFTYSQLLRQQNKEYEELIEYLTQQQNAIKSQLLAEKENNKEELKYSQNWDIPFEENFNHRSSSSSLSQESSPKQQSKLSILENNQDTPQLKFGQEQFQYEQKIAHKKSLTINIDILSQDTQVNTSAKETKDTRTTIAKTEKAEVNNNEKKKYFDSFKLSAIILGSVSLGLGYIILKRMKKQII